MTEFKIRVNTITNIDLPIDSIEVGERFRKDYGDLAVLAQSITKEGLIHPIAVSKNPPESSFSHKLVAGGRRFAAIKMISEQKGIKLTEVSCRIYDRELSDLELRSIEFAENLYRKGLTWQEEIQLKSAILKLQQEIHGKKLSTTPGSGGFSIKDLSDMTGKSKSSLSMDISLANMIQDTPEIDWKKFETKSDAMKAIKQAKTSVKTSEDAKIATVKMGEGNSFKKRLVDSYFIGDFLAKVKLLNDASFDFIEIDPPYAIALEKVKKDYDYTGYNEIHPKAYPAFLQEVYKECYRVLKPNSWMISWFGPDPWFEDIYQWITSAGFKTKRIVGLWVKGSKVDEGSSEGISGQTLQPMRDLGKGYEMFYYARKGVPELHKPGASNVFGHMPIPPQQKVHPTERPRPMIKDVLDTFTGPNSHVLVPFAGSGNTLLAAAELKMTSMGFDLTEEYKESFTLKVYNSI